MLKKRLFTLLATMAMTSLLISPAAMAYSYSQTWGNITNEGAQDLYLSTPVAIMSKDAQANLYVADMGNNRIVKVSQDGHIQMKFGSYGTEWSAGKFNLPFGVKVDNKANIIVADTANYRIHKYSSNWTLLKMWGGYGTEPGKFGLPREIAVDSRNYYHVGDEFNDRVQVFDEDGNFMYQYGGFGTEQGKFRLPQGLAIFQSSAGDRVYVSDTYNNRIQILDRDGNFITQIGTTGVKGTATTPYLFNHPRGVSVDAQGNVYIADTFNQVIKVYAWDGSNTYTHKYTVGYNYATSTEAQPLYPNEVLPLDNGEFLVSDTGNSLILRYQETSPTTAAYLGVFKTLERSGDGVFAEPVSADTDAQGNVYVVDRHNHRIQKFSNDGTLIAKWGKNSGAGGTDGFGKFLPGQFYIPNQIFVDKTRNLVFVADTGNIRIQILDTAGNYVGSLYHPMAGSGYAFMPVGVAVDSQGNIFLSDSLSNGIYKFNSSNQFVKYWGGQGMTDGKFREPYFIAIDAQDNVYVADRQNNRIQKFDNNGNFLTKWGANGGNPSEDPLLNWGMGDGDLFLPIGLEIDAQGNVIVGDASNNRVEVFTSEGAYISQFGAFGAGNGNFFNPWDFAIDSSGKLFIPDALQNSVQVFTP